MGMERIEGEKGRRYHVGISVECELNAIVPGRRKVCVCNFFLPMFMQLLLISSINVFYLCAGETILETKK